MTLVLMDMGKLIKEIGIFNNYGFATTMNKLTNHLIHQFVCYRWLQQNQINSK